MVAFDGNRVLRDLRHLRTIGAYKTGVHRPALSPEHVASLHWLKSELDQLGHRTAIDGIGNVFGFSDAKGRKLLSGSHLESQNHAGWLDGPLGVVYALEAARVLNNHPTIPGAVEIACWCEAGSVAVKPGS